MKRNTATAVAIIVVVALAAGAAAVAPDWGIATPAAHAKHKKKRFKRYFTFRMIGDGCVPGDPTFKQKPRFILFGAEPADPRHPLAPHGLVTIGEDIAVCLPGFKGTKPMTIRVSLPDGSTEERSLVPDPALPELHGFTWFAEPGAPLGRYELTAEQGRAIAHASLIVRRTRGPVLSTGVPSARVGGSLHLVFAGFRPNERVRVGVYRLHVRRCPGQRSRPRGSVSFCFTGHVFARSVDSEGALITDVPIDRAHYRSGNEYWLMALARSTKQPLYGPRVDVCPASTPASDCGLDEELLP